MHNSSFSFFFAAVAIAAACCTSINLVCGWMWCLCLCVCLVMQSARWSAALRLHWQKAVENNYSKVSAIFMPDVNEEETLHGGKGTWRLCSLWQRLLMAFPQNTNTERDGDYAERERESCLFFDALLTLIVEFNLSTRCTSREYTKCNIISLSLSSTADRRRSRTSSSARLCLFANGCFKYANYFAGFKFQFCNLFQHQNAGNFSCIV